MTEFGDVEPAGVSYTPCGETHTRLSGCAHAQSCASLYHLDHLTWHGSFPKTSSSVRPRVLIETYGDEGQRFRGTGWDYKTK